MTTAPMNPLAGPSGPSKFSTRTDNLQMGSTAYGEGKDTQAILSGAALGTTPDVAGQAPSKFREGLTQTPVTELYASSSRPGEAATTGIVPGGGAGPEALMMNQIQQGDADIIAKYMPALDAMASAPDTPQTFRIFVRSLQGNL